MSIMETSLSPRKQLEAAMQIIKQQQEAIERFESADLVEVVRCKDCWNWQDRQIKLNDGSYRDYLPEDGQFVTNNIGINIGSHCTLHGFEDSSGSWFWANGNDFCSKGERREPEGR